MEQLGELPSLEMCDSETLNFLPTGASWNWLVWAPPAEHVLSPPSFCSSSHPRRALSGRTSMSGPNMCSFEHHSLRLARCQLSGRFRCHPDPLMGRNSSEPVSPPEK